MDTPSFIHKKEEYLDRVSKDNTDVRLLAKHSSLEVMKQKIARGSPFYLDSSEDWQGFEFIYLIKGKMEYTDSEPPLELGPGDYISRKEVPEESWFETKTDVTVLYTSTQPAFYLLREEIEDYLKLAERIESAEHMEGHSKRMARMSQELGKRLGLSTERLADLRYASFFHDIGKSRVPDRILEKEGDLTEKEWGIMEKHTLWGKEMLKGTDPLTRVGKIVKQSHERVDGEGYPEGLSGEEILLEAKIIAVVDAWDAMRTDRPYRDALSEEEAIAELKRNKGSQFGPKVAETFLNLLGEKEDLRSFTTKESSRYREEAIQLRQRERLLELSKKVLSAESAEKVAEKTLEAVVEATTFQRALISVFDCPIDPEDPKPARVSFYRHKGLSSKEESRLEEAELEGVEVNLEKFDPKYKLGESYYLPHEERGRIFEEEMEIASQLGEEATLDWHPDDSLYIPLYKEGEIIGQISVDDPEDRLVPSPESLQPIESFASLASVGIEKTSPSEEQKKRKDKLEAFQGMIEGSSQAIFLFQDGGFKFVNESFEKLSGYSKEELNDINFLQLVHPDHREKVAEWTRKALRGDVSRLPKRVEYKALTKEGETIWVRSLPSLIEYKGRPAIVGNAVDITEEKELQEDLKRKDRVIQSASEAIALADMEGRLEYVNPSFLKLWGHEDREEVLGRLVTDFWANEEEAEKVLETLKDKGEWSGELLAEKKDGTTFYTHGSAGLLTDAKGEPTALLSSFIDLTDRKETERALKEERNRLKGLHDAVDQLQRQDREEELLQTVVNVAENMLEFEICAIDIVEGDYLVPKAISTDADPEEAEKFKIGEGITGKSVQRGETIWGDDVRDHPDARPTSGEFRSFISIPIGRIGNFQVVSKEVGSFSEQAVELAEILVGHLREEIKRVRLKEELREQAIRDPLTELYNRRYFNETLQKEVERCKRYGNPLAFIMTDVNSFKEVNDRYSHQTGDEVLQEVANLIKENVRNADTVVRYGGDEFLVMMPETKGEVESTATRLKEELSEWNKESTLLDFPLTLAMGISHWRPDQDRDAEEALQEADRKMYEDKGR